MQCIHYPDAARCYTACEPLLLAREAENNLIIGIILRVMRDGNVYGRDARDVPLFAAVTEVDLPRAVAVMTPPHRLALTRGTMDAMTCLAHGLHDGGIVLPGVMGPTEAVDDFLMAWTARAGGRARLEKALRVYQLDRVIPPASVSGHAVPATSGDLDLLVAWTLAFNRDVGEPTRGVEGSVRDRLALGTMQLWNDPDPVSMAYACGPTPHGIRVSGVYTPPEYRGQGYASANVAALSQRQLGAGRRCCFLFTDQANPISNGIYQRLGYRPVSDFVSYTLA